MECRICWEDAESEDEYGEPLCKDCYNENTSCCWDWLDDEMRLCPSCWEHC